MNDAMRMHAMSKQCRRGCSARWLVLGLFAANFGAAGLMASEAAAALVDFRVVADGIPEPLVTAPGSAARGRALVVARESANCVLCHSVTDPAVRFSGTIGPALDGVGRRLSIAQLRLRVVDYQRVNANAVMPSYYRTAGLNRVAEPYRDQPLLAAQQIEDIVAWLATLTAP
jgi:L-cysteine S-thiosulfotransferase